MAESKSTKAFIDGYKALGPKTEAFFGALNVEKLGVIGVANVGSKGEGVRGQVAKLHTLLKAVQAEHGGQVPEACAAECTALFEASLDKQLECLRLLGGHAPRMFGIGLGLPTLTKNSLVNGQSTVDAYGEDFVASLTNEELKAKLRTMFQKVHDGYEECKNIYSSPDGKAPAAA